jgi:hypothetical protein
MVTWLVDNFELSYIKNMLSYCVLDLSLSCIFQSVKFVMKHIIYIIISKTRKPITYQYSFGFLHLLISEEVFEPWAEVAQPLDQ